MWINIGLYEFLNFESMKAIGRFICGIDAWCEKNTFCEAFEFYKIEFGGSYSGQVVSTAARPD